MSAPKNEKKVAKATKAALKTRATKPAKTAGAPVASRTLDAPLFTLAGEAVGKASLPESLFGGPINKALLWAVARAEAANLRRGTAKTKGRGEVSGGGKKPWKQKSTGNARSGSNRSPVWRHGGIVFGPKPRDYSVVLQKKVRKGALRSALAARAKAARIVVVRETSMETPRTRVVADLLSKFSDASPRRPLFILDGAEENLDRSIRNIQGARSDRWENLQTSHILKSDWLVFSEKALAAAAALHTKAASV